MRKKVIRVPQIIRARDQGWLDVNKAASVEVSSEDENYPIESALLGDEKRGWRAAEPGSQTIRLIFDSPQRLRRIWLAFEDSEVSRTQEFVLRWSSHVGEPFREIVRQQWNFSSPGGVREIEDYAVDLVDVGMLELTIVPDKSGGEARASLAKMRLS
jgi:XRCC1 N terminal domain